MIKKEVSEEIRKNIIFEYKARNISVDKMIIKFNLSRRVFYRILVEEGVNIKQNNPKKYISPPKHNLEGMKFSHLLVEKMQITKKSKNNTWRCLCVCDCGRTADINTNYLMRGLAKTCGHKDCSYHRQDYSNNGKNNIKFTGYEEISGQLWSSYRCNAERRNIIFDINIKDVWELFLRQNKKCSISNIDIFFGKTNTSERTASLDRIDSKKGYTIDNVHWVHKDINKMKMNLDMEKFINLCKIVSNNYEK